VKALAEFACATLARRLRRATRGCSVQSKGKLDGSASNTVFISDLFINECNLNFQFDWFETGVSSGPSTWRSLSKNGLSPYLTHLNGLGDAAIPARIRQGNAMALPYRDGTVDAVVTDPPYYDMVEYADGSDLFFVWLRRALYDLEPDLFGLHTPTQRGLQNKDDEIILRRVHEPGRVRHDKEFYEASLARAFREVRRVLKPDGHLVVVFGHSDPDAWRRLLSALREAGFVVTSAWPARTESANTGVASIKVTVTIGCQVAPERRVPSTAAQVEREIADLVRKRVPKWDSWGLALSDQLMASYGPAMQVVGRYRTMQRPDGSEPELDHFLAVGRRAVMDAHAFKVDELPLDTFDPHTRFSIAWMRAFQRTTVPRGEAVFHAQSSQMRVDELRPHIIEETKGGFVLTLAEPPKIGEDSPIIHVARAMAVAWPEGGTDAVAAVIAARGRAGDDAHLWATVAELVRQLPESDKVSVALTACQRNRRPIEVAARQTTARGAQQILNPTEGAR
jgi:adenine-specific DNA methylase